MSEIFEHSKLIEHLFAGRQPKLARIERKTTLEQYLSSNQDTIDNQEEDQESQSSIKFLPDIEFWNFSKIFGSIISDIISHLKFKQIQEFFAKVIIKNLPSKKNFNYHFKQRKELVQGLFEFVLEWEDNLIVIFNIQSYISSLKVIILNIQIYQK